VSTIVAIGGGEISSFETLAIDVEIVKLTNKENPRALFIPTASFDAPGYCQSFKLVYGDQLGCVVDYLLLLDNGTSFDEIQRKITVADLIYVGGGDTVSMLRIWKEKGVDRLLMQAYSEGTILSGISAGSICWFEYGHDESPVTLEALGILKGIHSPHFNEEDRQQEFSVMLKGTDLVGVAIDNHCAVIFKDNEYKVITTRDQASAYTLVDENGEIDKKQIVKDKTFRPLNMLYGKS
jgi:dipeptidase E